VYKRQDSGGGKGIVCFTTKEIADKVKEDFGYIYNDQLSSITSLEMYDLNFAKQPIGLERIAPKLVREDQFQNAIDLYHFLKQRLKDVYRPLFNIIEDSEQAFLKKGADSIFIDGSSVSPVFDANPQYVSSDPTCTFTTMALQSGDDLFIDARLFDHPKHSLLSGATLLLHEFIYFHTRECGKTDSRSVRTLIRYILRESLDTKKIETLAQDLCI